MIVNTSSHHGRGVLTLATLIDFSTLAACRSRSSTFLLKDLIYAKRPLIKSGNWVHLRTYVLLAPLILFDDTWVSTEDQFELLSQRLMLVPQLICASFVCLP
jgi:hypothetical protein